MNQVINRIIDLILRIEDWISREKFPNSSNRIFRGTRSHRSVIYAKRSLKQRTKVTMSKIQFILFEKIASQHNHKQKEETEMAFTNENFNYHFATLPAK